MSFGTFTLFNFFQQPNSNTGAHPVVNDSNKSYILNNNGTSGTVGDFNWFFPYVRTNILPGFIQNPQDRYTVHLYTESKEIDNSSGLWYPEINTSFSGSHYGRGNLYGVNTSIKGSFSPKNFDSSACLFSFSGMFSGNEKSIQSLSSSFSGINSGIWMEEYGISSSFSGEFSKGGDFNLINNTFSGIINKGTGDLSNINSSMSGKFSEIYGDNSSINYGIFDYSVSLSPKLISVDESSVAQISYVVSDITIYGGA